MNTCKGCIHSKRRWRTFRFVSYCQRYRVERSVKCLAYRGANVGIEPTARLFAQVGSTVGFGGILQP